MAITDKKISTTYAGRDIASLGDRPNEDGLSSAQLKARFDQLGKEVIPQYNALIDELNDVVLPAKQPLLVSANNIKTINGLPIIGSGNLVVGTNLTWKGVYSSLVTYVVGDLVSYTTKTYVCISTSLNNIPTNATYWSLFIDIGNVLASDVTNTPSGNIVATNVQTAINELDTEKQPTLVSGTNIKTVNSESLLGSTDIELLPKNNPVATGTQTLPNIVTNGIKFPAVQIPSADSNTLDDYEKGTFTPTISFATTTGTITYTFQQGRYVKIGELVTVFWKCTFSQTGSSGFIKLSGLPFSVDGLQSASGSTYTTQLVSVTGIPIARADAGQTFAYLYQIINGDATPLGASNVVSVDIEFTMSYRAS